MCFWEGRKVTVTGGAGFIGSHLVEYLVWDGAEVTVADDLSRGRLANLEAVKDDVRVVTEDLREPSSYEKALSGAEIVINLAAKVTSISYNRAHSADMFTENMLLQVNPIRAAHRVGVGVAAFEEVLPEAAQAVKPARDG